MTMMNADFIRNARRQRGAALLTGLIFMVILTLLGITAARMAGLEERMSGNMRDRSLAMQAAERALRDAERDIRGPVAGSTRSPAVSGITNFIDTCDLDGTLDTNDDGLCDRRGASPTYANTTISFPAFSVGLNAYPALSLDMTAAPSVAYGRFTGAGAITGISAQPRYIVEGIRRTPAGGGEDFFYRVTVRAQGANPNTVVWLQEVYKPL
jgi:type IV pilus assembly protein PilX